jgi:hypothetical protein
MLRPAGAIPPERPADSGWRCLLGAICRSCRNCHSDRCRAEIADESPRARARKCVDDRAPMFKNLSTSTKLYALCAAFVVAVGAPVCVLVAEKRVAIDFARKELGGSRYLAAVREAYAATTALSSGDAPIARAASAPTFPPPLRGRDRVGGIANLEDRGSPHPQPPQPLPTRGRGIAARLWRGSRFIRCGSGKSMANYLGPPGSESEPASRDPGSERCSPMARIALGTLARMTGALTERSR